MFGNRHFPVFVSAGALCAALVLGSCSSAPDEEKDVYSRKTQADSLMEQGHRAIDSLEHDLAEVSYAEALGIYASLDLRDQTVAALLALGRSCQMNDDNDGTQAYFNHAAALVERSDNARLKQDVTNHLAADALRREDWDRAADLLEDSPDSPVDGRERAAQLRLQGSLKESLGYAEEASLLLEEAAQVALASDEAVEAALAFYKLASIASLASRYDEAFAWALKALEADKSAEYTPGIASDLRALAIISDKSGRKADAEDYYRRSWLAWRGLGRDEDAENSRMRLEEISGRAMMLP